MDSIRNTSTCAVCGYSWPTLTDGSHSCSIRLLAQLAAANQRADKAEACAAEMREVITKLVRNLCRDEESRLYDAVKDAKEALSSTCGTGWVRREELKQAIEMLRHPALFPQGNAEANRLQKLVG